MVIQGIGYGVERLAVLLWEGIGIIDQPDDDDTAGLRTSGAHSGNAAATSW